MSYWRFAAMIATSTLVMFGLMYIHTWVWDHVYFSETRAWMALLMGAVMAIVMLAFMLGMYPSKAVNTAIFAGAFLAFGLTTWLVRSQVTVSGVDFMEAMIPHHSIAVLTSTRAGIEDPRVRKLADEIIAAQRKEIAEMKYLIRAIGRDGVRAGGAGPRPAEQAPPSDAVRLADLATTDLEALTAEEARRVLGTTPACQFGYAAGEDPVAVATREGGSGRGAIKLHGRLVAMDVRYPGDPSDGFELSSGDVTVTAAPYEQSGDPRPADAHLRVGGELEVGYDGFYGCES